MMIMDLLVFLFITLLYQAAEGLKLLSISVPPYAFKGDSAHLECSYDLGSEKLYSVSWYKDHEEFYKYVPSSDRSQHSYNVDGVEVDRHNSNSQRVILKRITLGTTGLYKCEVSAEAPSFSSVKGDGYMEVIAVPNDNPKITSEEREYAAGDLLALNCTSGPSYPPAKITWYINGNKVPSDSQIFTHHGELMSTISSLRLEVGPHHLTEGRIDVRCEAVVETSPRAGERFQDLRGTHIFVQGHANPLGPCLPLLGAAIALQGIFIIG